MPILKIGQQYKIGSDSINVFHKLPVGIYTLQLDPFSGFFLSKNEDFSLPSKLYGDFSSIRYWMKTFQEEKKNVGILLSGLKGTGKTIEAKKFCIEAQKPVILITRNYGESNKAMIDFLVNPEFHDSIVFIDEFEKIFDDNSQQDLLSLLDGLYPTKFAFVFTVNEANINEYLVNRLGRIRYRKHYGSLDPQIVNEVVEDMLINKSHAWSIPIFFMNIGMCTFDLLTNLIVEMNRFNEDALQCGKRLNVEAAESSYTVNEYVNDKLLHEGSTCEDTASSIFAAMDMDKKPEFTLERWHYSLPKFENGISDFADRYAPETLRAALKGSNNINEPVAEKPRQETIHKLSSLEAAIPLHLEVKTGADLAKTLKVPELHNLGAYIVHPLWKLLPTNLYGSHVGFGNFAAKRITFVGFSSFRIEYSFPNDVSYVLEFKLNSNKYKHLF